MSDTLRLPFRPPLDWRSLHAFLAARVVPGVERVEGDAYLRTVATADGASVLRVRPSDDGVALELRLDPPCPAAWAAVGSNVRRMFDLELDPAAVVAALGPDPLLGPSVRARPGLRVPGGWEPFEVLVRAVLGQQVSVAAAARLAGRLAARFGEPVASGCGPGLTHLFPSAAALSRADPAELPVPRTRGAALVALAGAAARGELWTRPGRGARSSQPVFRGLPGIGPWTAQILAMRLVRDPDAFPAGDLSVRRALGAPGAPVSEAEAAVRAEAWRPWRAYAAQHLWAMDAERRSGRAVSV